jgi:hypothetical protein
MPLEIDLKAEAEIQYAYTDYALSHIMRGTRRSRSCKAVFAYVHEVMACKAGCARPYFCEAPERNLMNSYWDSCTVKVFMWIQFWFLSIQYNRYFTLKSNRMEKKSKLTYNGELIKVYKFNLKHISIWWTLHE